MGKFAALVEILEGMNTERFVSVVDQTAADRDRVTKFIEQIYSIRSKYYCRTIREVTEK